MDYSPPGSSVHEISQGRIPEGKCCHSLLQGIFLNQESKSCLLHCRWILYHGATWEAPGTEKVLIKVFHLNDMLASVSCVLGIIAAPGDSV